MNLNRFRTLLTSQTVKDTTISLVGLGLTAGVGMIFTVLMAKTLGPSAFGIFSALTAIVTIFSSMGDLGISSALINFLPKIKDSRSSLISLTFWFQTAVSLAFLFILSILSIFHQKVVPSSSQPAFILMSLLTAVYVLQGFAIGLLNAEKKFLPSSIVQSSDSVIKMLIVLGLFVTKTLSIELALLANIISCTVSVYYGLGRELINIRPIFPKKQLKEIFVFSKWIALSRVFSVTISRVDILLLNLLAGSFQTGLFAAASRITLLFALLVSSLGSVTAPRFSGFKSNQETLAYLKKVSILILGVGISMLLCIVVADPIVRLVYGERYLAAIPIFRGLTIAMIPFLLNIITTQPLIYTYSKPKFFASMTILQVAIIVVLDLLLIPKYQAMAPAFSLGIANTTILLISAALLMKTMKDKK